jgi:hypothetical protein
MVKLVTPTSVFVPHEWKDGIFNKCNDLPRFIEPQEIITYLSEHPELAGRLLEWIETNDKDAVDEYVRGIGTSQLKVH